jgi:hypothetical protein
MAKRRAQNVGGTGAGPKKAGRREDRQAAKTANAARRARRRAWIAVALLLAASLAGGVRLWSTIGARQADVEPSWQEPVVSLPPVTQDQVRALCSRCHQCPEPDVMPKSNWPKTVWLMSSFSGFGSNVRWKVYPDAVVHWLSERAPEKLQLPRLERGQGPGKLRMAKRGIPSGAATSAPFVSHIRLVDVLGDPRPELLVGDMRNGTVLMGRTGQPGWSLEPVAKIPNPAHVEAVDLDADGRLDLVVANLGSLVAMDHKLGSVEWLRQRDDGGFEPVTLARDLGRVSDVEPADMDGDGDVDLVVAEFGWRWTGHLLLLENRTVPGESPSFVSLPIDGNHGCSHVAVTDLDGDGARDIVALFSQEHELVRCYLNRDNQWTEFRDLYRAPHPAWGHSGFQLVDLDGDGDADVLLTNGDTYDDSLLKPWHGIRWLENRGELDFQTRDLVRMYGVYRAEAADVDGDGDADVVACALAEKKNVDEQYDVARFQSILWLEQVARGEFVHRSFEASECHHPTLTLAEYDLDGDIDLLVGNGQFDDTMVPPQSSCVDLWENRLE